VCKNSQSPPKSLRTHVCRIIHYKTHVGGPKYGANLCTFVLDVLHVHTLRQVAQSKGEISAHVCVCVLRFCAKCIMPEACSEQQIRTFCTLCWTACQWPNKFTQVIPVCTCVFQGILGNPEKRIYVHIFAFSCRCSFCQCSLKPSHSVCWQKQSSVFHWSANT
jgi:hypothetical protein